MIVVLFILWTILIVVVGIIQLTYHCWLMTLLFDTFDVIPIFTLLFTTPNFILLLFYCYCVELTVLFPLHMLYTYRLYYCYFIVIVLLIVFILTFTDIVDWYWPLILMIYSDCWYCWWLFRHYWKIIIIYACDRGSYFILFIYWLDIGHSWGRCCDDVKGIIFPFWPFHMIFWIVRKDWVLLLLLTLFDIIPTWHDHDHDIVDEFFPLFTLLLDDETGGIYLQDYNSPLLSICWMTTIDIDGVDPLLRPWCYYYCWTIVLNIMLFGINACDDYYWPSERDYSKQQVFTHYIIIPLIILLVVKRPTNLLFWWALLMILIMLTYVLFIIILFHCVCWRYDYSQMMTIVIGVFPLTVNFLNDFARHADEDLRWWRDGDVFRHCCARLAVVLTRCVLADDHDAYQLNYNTWCWMTIAADYTDGQTCYITRLGKYLLCHYYWWTSQYCWHYRDLRWRGPVDSVTAILLLAITGVDIIIITGTWHGR